MARGRLFRLLSFLPALLLGLVSADVTTSVLRPEAGQAVSAPLAAFWTRSRLECVKECGKHAHCRFAAFVAATRACYLEPTVHTASAGDSGVTVWRKKDAICRDAPSVAHGSVGLLRHTLTSVSGDVTCDADSLWSGSDAAVVDCQSNGTWTSDGECRQYHWSNPMLTTFYAVPRTPGLTWKMCLTGTALYVGYDKSRFSVIVNNDGQTYRLLHADFRRSYFTLTRTTVLNTRGPGGWGSETYVTNWPFPDGKEFSMEISPASDTVLRIYVNGIQYTEYEVAENVTEITGITLQGPAIDVTYLNVWCT